MVYWTFLPVGSEGIRSIGDKEDSDTLRDFYYKYI